jgi:outer membrane protein, heavy metal efflux system
MKHPMIAALLVGAGALLTGCATPSLTQLQAETQQLRVERSTISAASMPLGAALAEPLDADRAVRVALLNNSGVRATLAQLQLAQGDLYDALHPANPSLEVSILDAAGGVTRSVWSVSQPLLDLLFVRYRRQHGELAMLEARQRVADQLLRLERDVRQAWLTHTAAALRLRVAMRAAAAAQLGALLAERYYEAGNVSELQWRAEQALASEAELRNNRREAELLTARTSLLDLLGLAHNQTGLRFDERLSLPAELTLAADTLGAQALQQRLDLAARRSALELARRKSSHARRWRWLPAAELRMEGEQESGQSKLSGPGATVQLPLLNTGAGQVARARARLAIHEAELAMQELEVRNRVARDTALLAGARRGFDVHARQLLELNQRILELRGAQRNYMLIGSFDLLATRRHQIEGHDLWIDAIESWWRTFNNLTYESGTALPVPAATEYVSAENLP